MYPFNSVEDGDVGGAATHEAVDEGGDAPREPELEVFVEVGAQVVAVEPIEDLERLATRQDCQRNLLFILGQQVGHARRHLTLAVLDVERQSGGEASTQVAAEAVLHVQVHLLFVHVQHQRLRVERQVELVNECGQPVDLVAQSFRNLRNKYFV